MRKMKITISIMLFVIMLFTMAVPQPFLYAEERMETENEDAQKPLEGIDFSSKRILVGTDDEQIFTDQSTILSSYRDVYLLQFETEEAARDAYLYYSEKAEFAEVDSVITVADSQKRQQEEAPLSGALMSETSDPFTELQEKRTQVQGNYDIALIDTGAFAVQMAVSVLGGDPGDDNGHGQKMAELIYEQNKDAKILSIKALDANGHGSVSDIYAALILAMESNVRIINLSLSALVSADGELIERTIEEAAAKGIIVVGAAGNNGRNAKSFLPGGIDAALIVGAAGEDGVRASFSNYGESVDYNLVAAATSDAAAKMSGWLSVNEMETIPAVLNQGLIYEADYSLTAVFDDGKEESSFPVILAKQSGAQFVFADQDGNTLTQSQEMEYQAGDEVFVKLSVNPGYTLASTQIVSEDAYGDGKTVEKEERVAEDGSFLYSFQMPKGKTMVGSLLFEGRTNLAEAAAYGFGPGSLTKKSFDAIKPNLPAYLGIPYISPCSSLVNWEAKTASGFDCSGFVNAMVHWFYDDGSMDYPYTGEAFASVWWPYALDDAGLKVAEGSSIGEINAQCAAGIIRPGDIITFRGGDRGAHVAIVYSVSGNDATVIHAYSAAVQYNQLAAEVWTWDGAGLPISSEEFATQGAGTYYGYEVFRGTATDGYLKLHKSSSDAGITNGNRCYSLAGAVYTVYQGSSVKGTLTTDAAGNTNTLRLPIGSYTVKETTAAANYKLDGRSYTVQISSSHTASAPYLLNVSDAPEYDQESIEIRKESKAPYATQYPLEGAEFVIRFFDNTEGRTDGSPLRTWKVKTVFDEASRAYTASLSNPASFVSEESDALYMVGGKVVLPVGTISVEEVKPPAGFTLTGATLVTGNGEEVPFEEGIYIGIIRKTGDGAHLSYGNLYTMLNTPIEVHTLAVNKANGTHYAKAGEPVTIIDTVTMAGTDCERLVNQQGEWDYIKYRLKGEVRDLETGELLSSAEKSFITDQFDGHTEDLEYLIEDTSKLEGHTIYVSEYLFSYVTVNQGKGVKYDEETLIASEDETVFADMPEELKETQRIHFPKIETRFHDPSATEDEDSHVVMAEGRVTLVDTVSYQSLIAGETYTLTGVIMDKESREVLKHPDGTPYQTEISFTPETPNGQAELEFVIDFSAVLGGRTLVAFEELRCRGELIADHKDLQDEEQTVTVLAPEILTSLSSKDSNKTFTNKETLNLSDRVEISRLNPGRTYLVKGYLVDKTSGRYLMENGYGSKKKEEALVTELKVLATAPDAKLNVEFQLNASKIDFDIVAFEELYLIETDESGKQKETLVAEHCDIDNEAQTVRCASNPKTADRSRVLMWTILMAAGLSGLSALCLIMLKMKYKKGGKS